MSAQVRTGHINSRPCFPTLPGQDKKPQIKMVTGRLTLPVSAVAVMVPLALTFTVATVKTLSQGSRGCGQCDKVLREA